MVLVSSETVRRCLRDLSEEQFARFVCALWAARGAETRVVEGTHVDGKTTVVESTRGTQPRRLGVVTGRRVPVGLDGTDTDVDVLVLSRPASAVRGTDAFAGRVVDADDIHAMVLYAVPRSAADDLCRRFFGRPLVADPTPSVTARAPEHSASLVVGLVGLSLLVVSVFGGPMLYGDSASVFGAPDSVGASPVGDGETVDPATTSVSGTESASFQSLTYPPGLGPGGVVDHSALADAHAKAVTGQSYRLTITHREYVDGKPFAYRRETVYVAGPTEYRSVIEGAGSLERGSLVVSGVEAYADGETRYQRRVVADEFERVSTVEETPVRGVRNGEERYADRVEQYVGWFTSVSESEIVDVVDRDGTRYYWVRLGDDTYTGIENSSGSVLVDENGVVHEVSRQYEYPGEGGVSAVVSIRYTDFGTTHVSPPAWYDDREVATENATEAENATEVATENATEAKNATAVVAENATGTDGTTERR